MLFYSRNLKKMNIENNKLIANFMGLVPKLEAPDIYSYKDAPYFSVRGTLEDVCESLYSYVKYSSSWDWIMPVVYKIKEVADHSSYDNLLCDIDKALTDINLKELYLAVVDFINYYNDKR